jgi:hypothetical protein
VICSQTVLELAVVYSYLDGDSGINETNDGRRNSDEVAVSSIACACEADNVGDLHTSRRKQEWHFISGLLRREKKHSI